MSIKQKKSLLKTWLSNLYHIGTLLTLFFIMAQVFFARRAVIQSSEWEKAKMTIENIERFKENLKETALYGETEALMLGGRIYPDFLTSEGFEATDTLRKIYFSFFDNQHKLSEDLFKTIDILDAFSYPIIMGYANEFGSFQNIWREYISYNAYVMPLIFKNELFNLGLHAQLLYRLWRVRIELYFLPRMDVKSISDATNSMLFFEGSEVTPATLKQYEKKLKKELKKIQKEIEVFRKNR